MTVAEHMQVDLTLEADMSSVGSSPAAPPSHSVGLDGNPLVMVGHSTTVAVAPAPPPSLQPNPAPVITSVAAGMPLVAKSATPPEPAQTFACEFPGCHTVSNSCCLELLNRGVGKHCPTTFRAVFKGCTCLWCTSVRLSKNNDVWSLSKRHVLNASFVELAKESKRKFESKWKLDSAERNKKHK